jgi:anti-sigma regulatory factor (Ser/Thr protein kinase)
MVSIGTVARALGVSPSHVRVLTNRGVLSSSTTEGGHRRYHLPTVLAEWAADRSWQNRDAGSVEFTATRPLDGLAEHEVWTEARAVLFPADEPRAARTILGYAFTEMLNNAIDHSRGSVVTVTVRRIGDRLVTTIDDDGIGVFANLVDQIGLPDAIAAIQELTKGKLTTDPSRHTGQGIFFTSKAVDVFALASNGIEWIVDNLRDDVAIARSDVMHGTRVTLTLGLGTARSLAAVFDEFSSVDGGFTRTRPVVRLFEIGNEFVSRSEAKRLAARLEQFVEVELDFDRVDGVGQGFVDELFRVWAREHPGTTLVPIRMNSEVARAVQRGLPTA